MLTAQKIMLLGAIGVGKTSLVRRLVLNRFDADYKATLGVDIFTYEMTLAKPRAGASRINLAIWDLDGDLGETIPHHIYSKGASSALIIGDMTRSSTQESMVTLAKNFQRYLPGRPLAFVLNKADLVPGAEAIPIPEALTVPQIDIMKTSAKTGFNVQAVFESLAQVTLERGL